MKCADCGGEIAPYETIFSFNGEWLCESCFEGKRDELSLVEFAELIGSEVCRAEDLVYSTKGVCY